MPIRISNITLTLDEDISWVKKKACTLLSLSEADIKSFKLLRESVDARKKNSIKFNYIAEIECENEIAVVKRANSPHVKIEDRKYEGEIEAGDQKLPHKPLIVGMGPAGLFAGLFLAQRGYKPIIIERGERVEDRTKSVEKFWKEGKLNVNSNVQFGEGGAGTFSDGKLTTRIKDPRCDYILAQMVAFGAPEEILYSGKPHIGTDRLTKVVKNIRQEIIKLGGEVRFNSTLEDINIADGKIASVKVNGEELACENLILTIGHSARDTYEMLLAREVKMEPKAFAIGVRIEHLQRMIDENQYGPNAGHKRLPAASYQLSYRNEETNRSAYTFCMCPGGRVINAASEENGLVVNGMSYYRRDMKNGNSAVVVNVHTDDFEGDSPLAGMYFQRKYEQLAFKEGGSNYNVPIQLVGDFIRDRRTRGFGSYQPSINSGYSFGELKNCLPAYVTETLQEALVHFERKIKGFARKDAILIGIETRTSAPVRILRDESGQSVSVKGLYPGGEGAGYAGGIISASVDGIRCAEKIVSAFCPID